MSTLFCKPKQKNFKNGTVSLQWSVMKKLRNGEYTEVVIVDRISGTRITFDPDFVLKHAFVHTYTVKGRFGKTYLKRLTLFRFDTPVAQTVSNRTEEPKEL